jgi:hypothetical protein
MITPAVRLRCRSWARALRPPRPRLADAEARLRNRAGAIECALRPNAFVGECRAAAKATPDIKPAQNVALPCAQKSLRLMLVGAKPTVRIT